MNEEFKQEEKGMTEKEKYDRSRKELVSQSKIEQSKRESELRKEEGYLSGIDDFLAKLRAKHPVITEKTTFYSGEKTIYLNLLKNLGIDGGNPKYLINIITKLTDPKIEAKRNEFRQKRANLEKEKADTAKEEAKIRLPPASSARVLTLGNSDIIPAAGGGQRTVKAHPKAEPK